MRFLYSLFRLERGNNYKLYINSNELLDRDTADSGRLFRFADSTFHVREH